MIPPNLQNGGVSWTKLEPFSRDKSRREGIPTPFPTVGGVVNRKASCVHRGLVAICDSRCIPDFGRF